MAKLIVERRRLDRDVLGEIAHPLKSFEMRFSDDSSRESLRSARPRARAHQFASSTVTTRLARVILQLARASIASAICLFASVPMSTDLLGEFLQISIEGPDGVLEHGRSS